MLEAETCQLIGQQLESCGWAIQVKNRLNLFALLGVTVCEMDTRLKMAQGSQMDAKQRFCTDWFWITDAKQGRLIQRMFRNGRSGK